MSRKKETGKKKGGLFANRGAGFKAYLIALILVVVASLLYATTFQSVDLVRYYAQNVYLLPLLAAAVSVVLAMIRPLAQWAPMVLFIAEVFSMCQFFDMSYLYLTSNFFGGVSLQAILGMNGAYLACVILYVAILIISVIAIFAKSEKKLKED